MASILVRSKVPTQFLNPPPITPIFIGWGQICPPPRVPIEPKRLGLIGLSWIFQNYTFSNCNLWSSFQSVTLPTIKLFHWCCTRRLMWRKSKERQLICFLWMKISSKDEIQKNLQCCVNIAAKWKWASFLPQRFGKGLFINDVNIFGGYVTTPPHHHSSIFGYWLTE